MEQLGKTTEDWLAELDLSKARYALCVGFLCRIGSLVRYLDRAHNKDIIRMSYF